MDPVSLPKLPRLCLAVVGHIEWVDFLAVDRWPQPGLISHAKQRLEEPAGAGAVIAVQLAQLVDWPVHFFTALGRDSVGEACVQRLQKRGVEVHVAWRDAPTRRGISLVDEGGDRGMQVKGTLEDSLNIVTPKRQRKIRRKHPVSQRRMDDESRQSTKPRSLAHKILDGLNRAARFSSEIMLYASLIGLT